ncbi:hypothetical protein Ga0074812_107119 [Parafrankia irregularis]|uniref:Ferritin-like domain-containing protein n=1 Tax=Parafrankia irregularis TaxID=795642 RepID=A0A0S4QKT2_9ACTN|nr:MULTISPECIES: hypothetical protein [Parafrankia]MBE3201314.1 hypothetical protein [Parafrankia sp. CH37]CUU56235.1 hypothetical protein Ga0074812_107119 [Parafrankia irregularis]
MVTTAVRPETGAVIKPGPMVTVPPDRTVQDQQFDDFAAGSGLNGPFLADQLSGFIAHERMSLNLLCTLHARTDNPALRSRYAELETETLQAVDIWERLIRDLGGNPQYASPAGRATEGLDNKIVEALLLSGSADPITFEQAGLQAFLAGANQCVANAALLSAFAEKADDGAARKALTGAAGILSKAAAGHTAWALNTLRMTVLAQAKHPTIHKIGQAAEKAVDAVRNAVTPG